MLGTFLLGESNGRLPLRTCAGCSIREPYQSPDWVLVPAKPVQGLNTNYYYTFLLCRYSLCIRLWHNRIMKTLQCTVLVIKSSYKYTH
jgi:hypothetical protein